MKGPFSFLLCLELCDGQKDTGNVLKVCFPVFKQSQVLQKHVSCCGQESRGHFCRMRLLLAHKGMLLTGP